MAAEVAKPELPHVAEMPSNVVDMREFATRGGNDIKPKKSGSKAKSATRGGKWQVDAVKASKGTWAFRIRWAEGATRGTPLYVTRVTDSVYKSIRKGNYAAFKNQLIASYGEGAVRASNQA